MYIKEKYIKEVVPSLKNKLGLSNVMQIPKIEKVVLNMWIWTYIRTWNKDYTSLKQDLALISWQQPVVRLARKAISNFKVKRGMPVWLSVTLRGDNMWAFLEKVINIVLPRVKDFRWLSKKSFDEKGNYNFWIKEHTIFPEVVQLDVIKHHGLQITIKTNTGNKDASRVLLEELWFPFSK